MNRRLSSEMKICAGLRLRAARLTLGVQTEKAMAKQLGVSLNAYNNYELGIRLADVGMAVRLLEWSGIGPDWIYAGSTAGVPFNRVQSLEANFESLRPTTPANGAHTIRKEQPSGPVNGSAEPAAAHAFPTGATRRRISR